MSLFKTFIKGNILKSALLIITAQCRLDKLETASFTPLEDRGSTSLSPSDNIKQACLHSVNSSSTLLTTTVHAIVDVSNRYKVVLLELISLLDELALVNDSTANVWDRVIHLRLEITSRREELNKLLLYMNNVEKVVEATIEAAFSAEAEYICKTLCERSHSATEELRKCKSEVEALEQLYLKAQVLMAKQLKVNDTDTT